jgi:hypothetical protein
MTPTDYRPTCPNCVQSDATSPVAEAAVEGDPALARNLAAPRTPRHHGRSLGCATLLISTAVGLTAGALVGVMAMLVGMDAPTRADVSLNDAGIFSAILAFMAVFSGVYAFFVWRQARADAQLRKQFVRWHLASERWKQLVYCRRCDGVFVPGQQHLTPADQIQPLLYEEERPAQPSTSVAAAP